MGGFSSSASLAGRIGMTWRGRPPLARGVAASLGQCFDSSLIQSYSKRVRVIGGTKGGVLTEQVRNGFYWWVPLLSAISGDGNVQALDVFLVEPRVYPIPTPVPFVFLEGPQTTPDGCYKIVPATGNQNSADVTFQSHFKRAAGSLNQLPAIFVPGGWALLLTESNNVGPSGVNHDLTILFLKAEIQDGCPPPF